MLKIITYTYNFYNSKCYLFLYWVSAVRNIYVSHGYFLMGFEEQGGIVMQAKKAGVVWCQNSRVKDRNEEKESKNKRNNGIVY